MKLLGDFDPDRLGEAGGLVEPRLRVPAVPVAEVGKRDDGAGAAAELGVGLSVENAQTDDSSSSCSMKLTGRSG